MLPLNKKNLVTKKENIVSSNFWCNFWLCLLHIILLYSSQNVNVKKYSAWEFTPKESLSILFLTSPGYLISFQSSGMEPNVWLSLKFFVGEKPGIHMWLTICIMFLKFHSFSTSTLFFREFASYSDMIFLKFFFKYGLTMVGGAGCSKVDAVPKTYAERYQLEL